MSNRMGYNGLAYQMYVRSLPQRRCTSCSGWIARGVHRVMIRCSWLPDSDTLCVPCWQAFRTAALDTLRPTILRMADQMELWPDHENGDGQTGG